MVDLPIPFLKKKKKDKTPGELQEEINSLQKKLDKSVGEGHDGHGAGHGDHGDDDFIVKRLNRYGFAKPVYDSKDKTKIVDWTGQEEFEKFQHRIVKTEFPDPETRFRLVLEYPNFNIEQTYYWFLRYFQETWGFEKAEKIIDTHASSVASSIFGNMQTRLGAQQNQASQYLKGVSEMVKGLFQIVREIRIIDDRLSYYYDSDKDIKYDEHGHQVKKNGEVVYLGNPKNALSSEIVLKGLWIDQVEGGAKNPGSVYGLSQTIGFTILPDLFFRIQISDPKNLEDEVNKLQFNEKVKEVLKRKLRQYYEWKWRTKKELQTRRTFEIRYLKQHYDTIRLYMEWVKPYLRNVRRLQLYEKNMEKAEIINAFESQIIEIEILFIRDDFGSEGSPAHAAACISMHLFFRVKPELAFHSFEYQHKGPIYAGMADITLRSYAWSHDDIANYKKYRIDEDLELLTSIDKSVAAALDALGDDLKKYLEEAEGKGGHEVHEENKDEAGYPDILDPFVSIFKGFQEIFTGMSGGKKEEKGEKKKKKPDAKKVFNDSREHHRAGHFAAEACFEGYLRYKMGPGGNLYWIEP